MDWSGASCGAGRAGRACNSAPFFRCKLAARGCWAAVAQRLLLTSPSLISARLSCAMCVHWALALYPGGGRQRVKNMLNSCGRTWQAAQKTCEGAAERNGWNDGFWMGCGAALPGMLGDVECSAAGATPPPGVCTQTARVTAGWPRPVQVVPPSVCKYGGRPAITFTNSCE